MKLTPAELAAKLHAMPGQIYEAIHTEMKRASVDLGAKFIPAAIRDTDPKPSGGAYAEGWTSTKIEGGVQVGNTTPESLFIERGRGPGPVPFQPILKWVKRKGFVRAQVKARKKAAGYTPKRDKRGRFLNDPDIERAEITAALAIQRKVEQQGFEPRWVVRRAVAALAATMPRRLRRALRSVKS